MFTGANAPTTVEVFPRGEAVHYAERAEQLGVPDTAIVVEPQAGNTGENFRLTRALLEREGIHPESATIISRPYQQRRAYATCQKPGPNWMLSVRLAHSRCPTTSNPLAMRTRCSTCSSGTRNASGSMPTKASRPHKTSLRSNGGIQPPCRRGLYPPPHRAEHCVNEGAKHSVSVAAVIFDASGENVLLIKRRNNGHWEPPGGVLELGETIEAGLRREVEEEAGVKIDIGPLTGVYQNVPGGIVGLVFRCTTTDVPVESSAEAFTVAWRCRADVAKLGDRYIYSASARRCAIPRSAWPTYPQPRWPALVIVPAKRKPFGMSESSRSGPHARSITSLRPHMHVARPRHPEIGR